LHVFGVDAFREAIRGQAAQKWPFSVAHRGSSGRALWTRSMNSFGCVAPSLERENLTIVLASARSACKERKLFTLIFEKSRRYAVGIFRSEPTVQAQTFTACSAASPRVPSGIPEWDKSEEKKEKKKERIEKIGRLGRLLCCFAVWVVCCLGVLGVLGVVLTYYDARSVRRGASSNLLRRRHLRSPKENPASCFVPSIHSEQT
jgi:hypothetical protein